MGLKKLLLTFILLLFGFTALHAQWDTNISQYWNMKNFYNPSFIAQDNAFESSLLHRRQWVGVTRAPVTSLISVNMPLELFGKRHGVGVIINNDKLGLFSNTSFMGQYSYQFKFKGNKKLNVGIQGGMFNIDFDAGKIFIPNKGGFDPSDPAIPTGSSEKTIDAGLGVSWIAPRYYIGLSLNHLWNPSFELSDDSKSYIARTYYLVGGYNIDLGSSLEFQPSVFYRTDEVFHQVDITARVEYSKLFNGGLSWRKDDGFVFLLGVKIKNIEASYAYDLSTSRIGKVSNGSHEIFIKYSMPLSKSKARGTLKSIRLL